jgi:hypothetical protein
MFQAREQHHCMGTGEALTLKLAVTSEEFEWAQQQVECFHYLHRRVHPLARPIAYIVCYGKLRVGCLFFGRMQSSRCQGWYGTWEDVQNGWCSLTQWELLTLMRVWLDPRLQRGHEWYIPNAASQLVAKAIKRVGYEYLLIHPPSYVDRPWELKQCISYCQSDRFLCTLYLASSFTLVRENKHGLRTYMRPLPQLQPHQRRKILEVSRLNAQARKRRQTAVVAVQQTLLKQKRYAA